ncbi:MAG: hypothetical protein JSW50_07465, partial [Candidatus Latescibacterota bacterium]
LGRGKDFKLYPGGGRPWDWRETGTEHEPGIQPIDVVELLNNGARVIVVGCGMNSRLQTCQETIELLEEKNVPLHIKETREAVALYNKLAADKPVGGLFHTTC